MEVFRREAHPEGAFRPEGEPLGVEQLEQLVLLAGTAHLEGAFRPEGEPLGEEQLLLRKQVLYQAESEPESFSMATWDSEALGTGCRTTRCAAGWALHLSGQPVRQGEDLAGLTARAVAALGLTRQEYLGRNSWRLPPLFYLPDAMALARLRELAGEEP